MLIHDSLAGKFGKQVPFPLLGERINKQVFCLPGNDMRPVFFVLRVKHIKIHRAFCHREVGISLVEVCSQFCLEQPSGALLDRSTRGIERTIQNKRALIIISCSGGARMQEGILSLMQMAKTSSALERLSQNRLPYISILTDPTTGGVSASFAMLGDIILAEPGALIGFAGPRVIEQTIKEKLPDGFQSSESLIKRGLIDQVVHRRDMRPTLINLLNLLKNTPAAKPEVKSLTH